MRPRHTPATGEPATGSPTRQGNRIWELDGLHDVMTVHFGAPGQHEFVSHWDPDERTHTLLKERLRREPSDPVGYYLYPNDYPELLNSVTNALGAGPEHRGVVCPCATSGSLVLLRALYLQGKRRVHFVPPIYYAPARQAEILGFECNIVRAVPTRRYEYIPPKRLGETDVLWICNPHYSTGVFVQESTRSWIREQSALGAFIVADESLCPLGRELGPQLDWGPRIATVLSPHKVICSNQVKCCVLLVPGALWKPVQQATEILAGGVSSGGAQAIQEIVSGSLVGVQGWFLGEMSVRWRRLIRTLREVPGVDLDSEIVGHFASIFAASVDASLGVAPRVVERIAAVTGVLVIPGNRAYMPDEWGFNFRVNLARCSDRSFPMIAAAAKEIVAMATT